MLPDMPDEGQSTGAPRHTVTESPRASALGTRQQVHSPDASTGAPRHTVTESPRASALGERLQSDNIDTSKGSSWEGGHTVAPIQKEALHGTGLSLDDVKKGPSRAGGHTVAPVREEALPGRRLYSDIAKKEPSRVADHTVVTIREVPPPGSSLSQVNHTSRDAKTTKPSPKRKHPGRQREEPYSKKDHIRMVMERHPAFSYLSPRNPTIAMRSKNTGVLRRKDEILPFLHLQAYANPSAAKKLCPSDRMSTVFDYQTLYATQLFRERAKEMIDRLLDKKSITLPDRRGARPFPNGHRIPKNFIPEEREGTWPILAQVMTCLRTRAILRTVDPLLAYDDLLQLQVIALRESAVEAQTGCCGVPPETDVGDLIWVYRVRPSREAVKSPLEASEKAKRVLLSIDQDMEPFFDVDFYTTVRNACTRQPTLGASARMADRRDTFRLPIATPGQPATKKIHRDLPLAMIPGSFAPMFNTTTRTPSFLNRLSEPINKDTRLHELHPLFRAAFASRYPLLPPSGRRLEDLRCVDDDELDRITQPSFRDDGSHQTTEWERSLKPYSAAFISQHLLVREAEDHCEHEVSMRISRNVHGIIVITFDLPNPPSKSSLIGWERQRSLVFRAECGIAIAWIALATPLTTNPRDPESQVRRISAVPADTYQPFLKQAWFGRKKIEKTVTATVLLAEKARAVEPMLYWHMDQIQLRALKGLPAGDAVETLLFTQADERAAKERLRQDPAPEEGERIEVSISGTKRRLTSQQTKCIQMALTRHFLMVQAPPGSGKTTIAAVVAVMATMDEHHRKLPTQDKQEDEPPQDKHNHIQVICTAKTNAAVLRMAEAITVLDHQPESCRPLLLTAEATPGTATNQYGILQTAIRLLQTTEMSEADEQLLESYVELARNPGMPVNGETGDIESEEEQPDGTANKDEESMDMESTDEESEKNDEGEPEQPPEIQTTPAQLYGRVKERVIDLYQPTVILATTAALLNSPTALQRNTFSGRMIMDEASQLDICSFIALAAQLPRAAFVLFGDIWQLPPFSVDADRGFIHRFSASSTATRALCSRRSEVCQLFETYRSHKAVTKLVNTIGYHGRLRSGVRNTDRCEMLPKFPFPAPDFGPIAFYHMESESMRSGSRSAFNPEEADEAARIVEHLTLAGAQEADIAVVCFYRDQCRQMSTRLPDGIEVATIDGCQGKEYEVVVLLTTKTRGEDFSFLDDANRLIVALTRAKQGLIIIGDFERLRTPNWTVLTKFARKMKLMTSPSGVRGKLRSKTGVQKSLEELRIQ